MKHIKLTTQERQELKDLHKKGLAASEADKIKAILMLDDGYSVINIYLICSYVNYFIFVLKTKNKVINYCHFL